MNGIVWQCIHPWRGVHDNVWQCIHPREGFMVMYGN